MALTAETRVRECLRRSPDMGTTITRQAGTAMTKAGGAEVYQACSKPIFLKKMEWHILRHKQP
jgi:hypothetical protein